MGPVRLSGIRAGEAGEARPGGIRTLVQTTRETFEIVELSSVCPGRRQVGPKLSPNCHINTQTGPLSVGMRRTILLPSYWIQTLSLCRGRI